MAKSTKIESDILKTHDISKLTDFEHIRLRLEMYLGSRSKHDKLLPIFNDDGFEVKEIQYVPALFCAMNELLHNSLDEFKKGNISSPVLRVKFDESTMSFEITDNGRGIPIERVS